MHLSRLCAPSGPMLIATEVQDAPRRAALFAEIPLSMTDAELRRTFDQLLNEWLTEQGFKFSLRCFQMLERQSRPSGIGIDVQTDEVSVLAFAVEKIADLGAPPPPTRIGDREREGDNRDDAGRSGGHITKRCNGPALP